jgi:hypothetical protein
VNRQNTHKVLVGIRRLLNGLAQKLPVAQQPLIRIQDEVPIRLGIRKRLITRRREVVLPRPLIDQRAVFSGDRHRRIGRTRVEHDQLIDDPPHTAKATSNRCGFVTRDHDQRNAGLRPNAVQWSVRRGVHFRLKRLDRSDITLPL